MGNTQKEAFVQKEYPSVSTVKQEVGIVPQSFAKDHPSVSRKYKSKYLGVHKSGVRKRLSFKQIKSIIDNPSQSIFHAASESLGIAIRVLEDDLYSIKEKWIVLLRVLSVICDLTNREGLSSYIRRNRDTILSLIISITDLMTLKPVNNNLNSNKCSLLQLDIEEVKVRLNSLKVLLYDRFFFRLPIDFNSPEDTGTIKEDYKNFRPFKYGGSFMTSSTNIYVARGIYNLYEVISNTKNNTIAAVANDSLEQTQNFIANGCSSLPYLFEYSSSSGIIYEDISINETILIIREAGIKKKEVLISPELIEAVATACKTIKQYSMDTGKNICYLLLDLRDDEYIKHFINYGKYCELYHYFREDCKRLIFEGYLQTIMYSMLNVDKEMCNSEISSEENSYQMLKNQIVSFVDFKDDGTAVEQIYADYAMKYIHVHKKSLHNYISKMSQHLEKKHSNPDQVHKMLNISKNDYDEAKVCEDLDSFITKLVEGADFDVRKMAPENFYINVNNKVYVASNLLQYAVMEKHSGMNMVRKLLRLNADPRVENLRDGMSAVGIALLYEDYVEEFLHEITKRRYHLTDNKIDVNKCLISSDLRIIEDYSNREILMDSLNHLYYFM